MNLNPVRGLTIKWMNAAEKEIKEAKDEDKKENHFAGALKATSARVRAECSAELARLVFGMEHGHI